MEENKKSIPFPFLFFLFFLSFLVLSCADIFSAQLPRSPQAPIRFQSDFLEYKESEQIIIATGNVTVRQGSYTFQSDHAMFNLPKKNLEAWGLVRFMDVQGNEIRSRFLTFNSGEGAAQLLDAEGSFGAWIFSTKKAVRDSQGNFSLEKAKLSTCEMDLSKYHLYGHRIKIMPGKRLTVQHALFRIGPVPVLYLPYYYYSLGERHLAFQIFPGQSQSEGAFVRTVWGYATTEETYAKTFLDYMAKRGMGTGAEFDYYYGDRMKGSFYGYHVDDHATDRRRWNVRLYHWQKISPEWIFQSNANRMSDELFPNDFFREDFDRVARDLSSSVAFTHQKKSYYLRFFAENKDRYDLNNNNFYTLDAKSPQIELSQTQTPLGLFKIDKSWSVNFRNRYAGQNVYGEYLSRNYRRESDAGISFLKSLKISRQVSFTPRFSVTNQWIDRPQWSEMDEKWIQRLITQGTLRQQLGTRLSIDLDYLLSQRVQNNQGDDHGIENHTLTFFSWLTPASWFSFRFGTAHNLPRFRGEALTFLERKNYHPLRGELSLTPKNDLELFFREEYILFDPVTGSRHPLITQSEIVWGNRALGGNYFLMGTSYFASKEHQMELRHTARVSVFEKLQLEGTIRTNLFYNQGNLFNTDRAELSEKELLAKTEWRCWKFFFTFRERKGVFEFLFNIELKLDQEDKSRKIQREKESEFYPWRR